MPGRFEGLTDAQWAFLEPLFPPTPEKRRKGMPAVSRRFALNTILAVLYDGCRWCSVPKGDQWASKSSAHRWLKRWQEDGTWDHITQALLAIAQLQGKIDWTAASVDGSFSPRKRRR